MSKKLNGIKNKIHITAALSLLVLAFFAFAMPASAATTIIAGDGDAAAGVVFQDVNNIVIGTTAVGDITVSNAGIVITAPAGVSFNTTQQVFAATLAGAVVVGQPIFVGTTTINVPVTTQSGAADQVRISNIKVDVAMTTAGPANMTILTAGSPPGGNINTLNIRTPTVEQALAINLLAGVMNQTVAAAGAPILTIKTLNNLNPAGGQIAAATTISLTLPAGANITFNSSAPGTVSGVPVIVGTHTANVSADGLTLSTVTDAASGVAQAIITFKDFKLNTNTSALSNVNFNATTVTNAGIPITSMESTVFAINITRPNLAPVQSNLALGGTGQVGGNIVINTPATAPAGLIGAGTFINVTLPNTGITFDTSATVTVTGVPVIVGSHNVNISADGLTLSTMTDANSAAGAGNAITFTGIKLNVTGASALNVNYSATTTPAGAGAQPTTSLSAGNDILVFKPTATGITTVPLDADGVVSFLANNVVITTPSANGEIGNNTFINLTLPGLGVTFDLNNPGTVSSTGTIITGVRIPMVSANTLSILTNATSLAGNTVTISGFKLNVSTGASSSNLTLMTNASGAGAQPVTTVSNAQIVVMPITADSIVLVSGNTTPAFNSTNTYTWIVKNTSTNTLFGGQPVDFVVTDPTNNTLSVPSNNTVSDGSVSVNLTVKTRAVLNATIRGTAVTSSVVVQPLAGVATKLAVIPDVARIAPTGTASVIVQAQDAFGNTATPSVATTVRLTVSGDAFITPANAITATALLNAGGNATFLVKKATPGSVTLTASDEAGAPPAGLSPGSGVQLFTVDVGRIVVTATPTLLAANGANATLAVQLQDINGVALALPGQSVVITSNNATLATVSASPVLTNAAGIATVNLTANAIGLTGTVTVNASTINQSGVTLTNSVTVAITVPGFIAGRVTNASNASQPIVGATVSAGGLTATTNATGFYNLSIAAGTYTVNASAAGFAANTTAGVVVTAGATATVNFALVPAAAGPIGDVTGNGVTDITDALFIAQATVNLRTLTPAQLALADVNHDGTVNITDALFIAQASVGLRILV